MAEGGLDEYESWRCAGDTSRFCPPEGCPKGYCAIAHGWKNGDESPDECTGKRMHWTTELAIRAGHD
jgi:hypothetical protein